MTRQITPSMIQGTVQAVPSKSAAHRALICAAFSDAQTTLVLPKTNADIDATIACLTALGATFLRAGDKLLVSPAKPQNMPALACGESGSTLRFLLPVAAALGGAAFSGAGRLPERPLDALVSQLQAHGVDFSNERLPFSITGHLSGGTFVLPGDVSSQFVTGLLLAAPLTGQAVQVQIQGALQSAAYVDMTLTVMQKFGVSVAQTEGGFLVPAGQRYASPGLCQVEGDWSGAAFPLCLGALCGAVTVKGLCANTAQGDAAILPLLKKMGAAVTQNENAVAVQKGETLRAIEQDVSGIPDMVPALAAVLMFARGVSCLRNAGRLRLKESDRLKTTMNMVNALGGRAWIEGDSLMIRGESAPSGGVVNGENDHRIVMAAAVAACACAGVSSISDTEAASKSYPEFFEDFQALGGKTDVLNVWRQD